jgi:hypothetical protein
MKSAVALFFAVMIAACAQQPDVKPDRYAKLSPSEAEKFKIADTLFASDNTPVEQRAEKEANCLAIGGKYHEGGGLVRNYSCYVPRSDAYQKCTDSSQCTGECLSPDENKRKGQRAVGICEPSNIGPFGCIGRVENGRIAYTLCVD